MEDIIIPSDNVPADLRLACEQTLKRAAELKKSEPIVSYWCCFAAVQKSLDVPNRSKDGTKFLMTMLDCLEQMKAALSNNEAVTSEAAGSAYVENFALKVFLSADNDDRAGKCDKGTIRKFVVAGQFIEVLRCFEMPMSDEMEQKAKYARWKAADIAKALREGRTPTPGPPVPDEDPEELALFPIAPAANSAVDSGDGGAGSPSGGLASPPQASSRQGSFSGAQRPNIPSPPRGSSEDLFAGAPALPSPPAPSLTPPRNESGAWSTVATPGVLDPEEERKLGLSGSNDPRPDAGFPSTPTPPPSASPRFPASPSLPHSPPKAVRFMGPDGAPLSPTGTASTVTRFDETPAPPPSAVSAPHAPPPPFVPQPRAPAPAPARAPAPAPAPARAPPPAQPRSTRPPHFSTPIQLPAPTGEARKLTRRETETIQKHAKWAISALEFDDVETARLELHKALSLLG